MRWITIALFSVFLFLTGCEDDDDFGDEVEDATEEAGDVAENAGDELEESVD